MKIGIDARPLQAETRFRGIGKSLEHTLRALAKMQQSSDVRFVFYVDDRLDQPEILKLFPGATTRKIKSSNVRRGKYPMIFVTAFRAIAPKRGSIDVLLQADASLGVPKTVPTLAVFYDMIPILFKQEERSLEIFPNNYRKYKREIGRKGGWAKYIRILNSYKRAAEIAAISESSRKDLLKYRKEIKPEKTRVIYLGATKPGKDSAPSAKIKELSIGRYLLYVGGIDVRKNIVGLLKSYIELKFAYPDLRLIVVGKEFELKKQLEIIGWSKLLRDNPQVAKDILIPGFLKDADLHYLYKNASAFVFPSRYEGFGLPVIEAMQLGCPVVAYNNSSIPEVAGDAALLVKDGADMSPHISKLLDSKTLRDQLIKKGYEQAAKFTWENTAKQTLDALTEVATRNRHGEKV